MEQHAHTEYMDMAIRMRDHSAHPDHKVGAAIITSDAQAQIHSTAAHNFWPKPLKDSIGTDTKLGNASTTVHAEVAAILQAGHTQGAHLYVTELPCPNCAKAIVEAGIHAIYIDSHTHKTELGQKIRDYFDHGSKIIFESAGVGVYELTRENGNILTIAEPRIIDSADDHGITLIPIKGHATQKLFTKTIRQNNNGDTPFAACLAQDDHGDTFFLMASLDLPNGLSESDAQEIAEHQHKYTPASQPLNHLLMSNAKYGLRIMPGFLYSSQCPTSREFVNVIGAQHRNLTIDNDQICRDEWGLRALNEVRKHNLLELSPQDHKNACTPNGLA